MGTGEETTAALNFSARPGTGVIDDTALGVGERTGVTVAVAVGEGVKVGNGHAGNVATGVGGAGEAVAGTTAARSFSARPGTGVINDTALGGGTGVIVAVAAGVIIAVAVGNGHAGNVATGAGVTVEATTTGIEGCAVSVAVTTTSRVTSTSTIRAGRTQPASANNPAMTAPTITTLIERTNIDSLPWPRFD